MFLNQRKIKILQAIIDDYIQTAEPVGSRTIAKKHDLGISSATIRNEMSDLEEMGFIVQPHASSGRIPSDKGYRLYVDKLMESETLNRETLQLIEEILYNNIFQIDFLMEETAKLLGNLTNYTAIVTEPVMKKTILKQIKILALDTNSILIIAITDANEIKNKIFTLPFSIEEKELESISQLLNSNFQLKVLEDILEHDFHYLASRMEHPEILYAVVDFLQNMHHAKLSKDMYLSGADHMLAHPEFNDIQKAQSIYEIFEDKEILFSLFGDGQANMKVIIGAENHIEPLQQLSIVTTNYDLGENMHGKIGILGPTRMNYAQVISVLNGVMAHIEKVIRHLESNN